MAEKLHITVKRCGWVTHVRKVVSLKRGTLPNHFHSLHVNKTLTQNIKEKKPNNYFETGLEITFRAQLII